MKTCRHCGRIAPDNTYMCSTCERPLPMKGPSARLLGRIGITIAVPLFVWEVMTRLLRL
jgi:hypothetical protein